MKNFIKKSTIFLIVFILVSGAFSIFEPPKKAKAIWGIADAVFDAANLAKMVAEWAATLAQWAKEEAALALRDAAVKAVMNYMADETIKWIQGGGDPRFVTDFQGFMKDSANRAVGDVILQTDAAFICSPFKAQIMFQLQPTPKFSENVKCTLDDIVDNIDDFYSDFSKGGWIGYAEVMQPQNNYYGVALQVSANLNERTAKAVDAASKEIQAGSGFLSVKRCKGGGIENPSPGDVEDLYLVKDFKGAWCQEKNLETTTPGDVVAESVKTVINSDSQWAVNAKSIISGITNALINRLVGEGLSLVSDSLSSNENSAYSYMQRNNLSNIINKSYGGNKDAMIESIKMFLDAWKETLPKYEMAFNSNSEVIGALEAIKAKSCTIVDEPGKDNILTVLEASNVDEAIAKSNEAQLNLQRKINDLDASITEASTTIDKINTLYLEMESLSKTSTSGGETGGGEGSSGGETSGGESNSGGGTGGTGSGTGSGGGPGAGEGDVSNASLFCQTNQKLMSVKLFNGTIYAGGYGSSGHQASLYTCSGGSSSVQKTFNAESVFSLAELNGSLYASHERGDFSSLDDSTVYRLSGGSWSRVFNDSSRNLGMELKNFNNTLYLSSVDFGGSGGGAVFKTTDGNSWSSVLAVPSGCGTEFIANYNGTIYAGSMCSSKPAMFRGSGERVSTPYDNESGNQFSGMTSFGGNLYLGMWGNNCRIAKYNGSSFQSVYTCPSGHRSVAWMGVSAGYVYALIQIDWGAQSGDSHLIRSPSGDSNTWKTVATFSMPEVVWADVASDGTIYVAGGKHGSYGRVYKVANLSSLASTPDLSYTNSTSTASRTSAEIMVEIQITYSDFINKYNNQQFLLSVFSEDKEADEEVGDKGMKAELAREALGACGGGGGID